MFTQPTKNIIVKDLNSIAQVSERYHIGYIVMQLCNVHNDCPKLALNYKNMATILKGHNACELLKFDENNQICQFLPEENESAEGRREKIKGGGR